MCTQMIWKWGMWTTLNRGGFSVVHSPHFQIMCVYLILIAVFFGSVCLPILRQDDAGYALLVKSSEPKEMRAYCHQFRDGVTKRVWGEQCCHMTSDHSELFFFSTGGDIELIEELDALSCMVQEERFYRKGKPMQLVRLLRAKEASYHYNTQVLTAQDVEMWSYELPGHTPPSPNAVSQTAMMAGKAETIELHFRGKKVEIVAHGFEGKLL